MRQRPLATSLPSSSTSSTSTACGRRWRGTVKATDPDLYEAIETAQSLIKDGGETENATRVATGVLGQAEAVATFIGENG